VTVHGYAHLRVGKTMRRAHALAYEVLVGPRPDGKDLDHLCRTRSCVNPAHLEPVSRAENCRRGLLGATTRARQIAKTHCRQGHSLADAYIRPSGSRQCRSCAIQGSKKQKQRLREQRQKGN